MEDGFDELFLNPALLEFERMALNINPIRKFGKIVVVMEGSDRMLAPEAFKLSRFGNPGLENQVAPMAIPEDFRWDDRGFYEKITPFGNKYPTTHYRGGTGFGTIMLNQLLKEINNSGVNYVLPDKGIGRELWKKLTINIVANVGRNRWLEYGEVEGQHGKLNIFGYVGVKYYDQIVVTKKEDGCNLGQMACKICYAPGCCQIARDGVGSNPLFLYCKACKNQILLQYPAFQKLF